MDFSISICNQIEPAETLKKTAPVNSAFPGPLGNDSHKARVGWDDFVKLSDLLDPTKGFFALGEIIVKAEISPAKGVLLEAYKYVEEIHRAPMPSLRDLLILCVVSIGHGVLRRKASDAEVASHR